MPGKGTNENGWYRTIYFKNPANWALLVNRNLEIRDNLDYQLDESRRDKDKVREMLKSQNTLVVTKIEKRGNKKYGEWYVVILKQGQGLLSLKYECYIADALQSKEIILVQK